MGILDDILNPQLSPIVQHKRMLAENLKFQNENLKQKLLNDPTYSDQILAHLSRSAMTDKVAAKVPVGSTFEKAMSNIDAADPRRKMLEKLQMELPSIIRDSPYGTDPRESIAKAVQSRGDASKEEVYKFIQSRQGLFDTAPAPAEGYEEWERKNPGWTPLSTSLAFGAGSQLAAEGLKTLGSSTAMSMLPRVAALARGAGSMLSFLPATPTVPGILAKVAGAGLLSIGGMLAADATKRALVKSGAVELSENPLTRTAQEMAIAAPAFMGVGKLGGLAIAKLFGKTAPIVPEVVDAMQPAYRKALPEKSGLTEVFDAEPNQIGLEKKYLAWHPEAMTDKTAEATYKYKMDRMEKFKELLPEDEEAIALGIKTREQAVKDRFNINVTKDLEETAAADKLGREEIVRKAAMLREADSTISTKDSLETARRILQPTMEETREDLKFLKTNSNYSEEAILAMGPRDLAEARVNWEKHSYQNILREREIEKNKIPMIRDEILPPAVLPEKVISTGKPLKIMQGTPSVVIAGMDEKKQIPGFFTATEAGTKELRIGGDAPYSSSYYKDIQKEIGNESATDLGTTKNIITELGGNKDNIQAAKVYSFVKESAGAINSAKAAVEKATSLPKDTAIVDINHITQVLKDEVEGIVSKYGFNGKQQAIIMQQKVRELANSFKKPFMEEVESTTETGVGDAVADLIPSSSPSAAMRNQPKIDTLRRQKVAEWQKLNVPPKGEITEEYLAQHDSKLEAFFKKWKGLGLAGIAGAALIPISSLLSPSEAEASSLPGRAFTSATVDMLKASTNPIDKMVSKLIEAGHGSSVLTEDGFGIAQMMRGQSYAPKDVSIFPRTKVMNIIDKVLSPHTRGEIHFDARDANGNRLPFNPAVELGDRSQVINNVTQVGLKAVDNILKAAGITDSNLNAIAEATKPLVEKYHQAVNLEAPFYKARIGVLDDIMEGNFRKIGESESTNLSRQIKLAKKDISKLDPEMQDFYNILKKEREDYATKLTALQPTIDAFKAEHEAIMKDLASKYSTSRIALAADGFGMSEENPWLLSMLSSEERTAAERIASLNNTFKTRMQEVGHHVLNTQYMHHPAHPFADFTCDLKHLSTVAPDGQEAMRLVNFYHRSADSRLMIPDTAYIMGKYIPDAAKRIEIADMWKVNKPGGWDAVIKQMNAKGGYEGAVKMLNDIKTAFDPMDTMTGGKWLNRYASFEVARLLTLSPSVSFKHGLKLMGNFSIFTPSVSAEAMGYNTGLMARQLAQATSGSTFTGKDLVADLSKAYTNQSHLYAAVSDMAPYDLPVSVFDKWLTKWNEYGSAAVNGVEHVDRGQTFASAMLMASKRGMTPEQARYALMDSVLKVNFLTGPNNPKWLKDPLIRTMMMFQGTPFKILEQRAMLGYQAGKDVKNLINILAKLKEDVKQGEANFHWHMLKDELTRSKDIYGNAYSSQFLRQIVIMGAVIGTGKMAFDSDLWGHVVHIPGMQLSKKGMQLGVNPAVSATYQTISGANIKKEEPDEFWLSRFMQTYMGGKTPTISTFRKIARLSNDDIPAMYKDSKINYLFGVPKVKD